MLFLLQPGWLECSGKQSISVAQGGLVLNWEGVVFNFLWVVYLFWLKEGLDVKVLSHSEMSQKCSCQWGERQTTGMTPYVPDDFGKTLTATQEGKLFSLLFFSSCRVIKSQMSDTARHPKSAHCINISHRWQLCIKITSSYGQEEEMSVGTG